MGLGLPHTSTPRACHVTTRPYHQRWSKAGPLSLRVQGTTPKPAWQGLWLLHFLNDNTQRGDALLLVFLNDNKQRATPCSWSHWTQILRPLSLLYRNSRKKECGEPSLGSQSSGWPQPQPLLSQPNPRPAPGLRVREPQLLKALHTGVWRCLSQPGWQVRRRRGRGHEGRGCWVEGTQQAG